MSSPPLISWQRSWFSRSAAGKSSRPDHHPVIDQPIENNMLQFTRHSKAGSQTIAYATTQLVIAGWAARDEASVKHHIEELAAIGVPPPSSVPLFYRTSASLL